MALSALDYPTDIRWERICVSKDMLDPHGCDAGTPPRWNSSIAVFRYVPEDDYQVYEKRRIVYFKVACTITSYQPQADEITGAVDWAQLTASQVADFQKKLSSYLPCNGAVVQVSVTPHQATDLDEYPYFLDFQPKQRTLYEQVVDSQEQGSRSLETLNVRKGGGTTQSTEVLDIDQGFSAGAQGSYAGTGGGFNVSHSGQWGTKQLTQDDANNVRTVDASRETRDTISHTTQLSQMYTLFQAYHLGTNRGLFFITPRPHLVEEPSGFIQGPRKLDGIQEIFLVVSQKEGQELPCLTVRLDTSHLSTQETFDFDRSQPPGEASASAVTVIPTKDNSSFVRDGGYYDTREIRVGDSDVYPAPAGYVVESTEDTINTMTPLSTSSVTTAADKRSVTVAGEAVGQGDFRNLAGDAANQAALIAAGTAVAGPLGTIGGAIAGAAGADIFPKTHNVSAGSFERKVKVNLVSEAPTKKTGEQYVLLVTSRSLCCCPIHKKQPGHRDHDSKIIGVQPIDLGPLEAQAWPGPAPVEGQSGLTLGNVMNARTANRLGDIVNDLTKEISTSVASVGDHPGFDRLYLLGQLARVAVTSDTGTSVYEPAGAGIMRGQNLRKVAHALGKDAAAVSRFDLLAAPTAVLRGATGMSERATLHLQLQAMGLPTNPLRKPRAAAQPLEEAPA